MRIIPVIDLMDGVVVHAVAGQRASYQPINSPVCENAEPLNVAKSISLAFGLQSFYVADLNAIQGTDEPWWDVLQAIGAEGRSVMLDAGIRDANRARQLVRNSADAVTEWIVGSESLVDPSEIGRIHEVLEGRVTFSLDLHRGRPLVSSAAWKDCEPMEIVAEVARAGVSRLIVLDLARVGVGKGVGDETLCRRIRSEYPLMHMLVGGGVRNGDDLRRLWEAGCDGALVATALHDGRLPRGELDQLSQLCRGRD